MAKQRDPLGSSNTDNSKSNELARVSDLKDTTTPHRGTEAAII